MSPSGALDHRAQGDGCGDRYVEALGETAHRNVHYAVCGSGGFGIDTDQFRAKPKANRSVNWDFARGHTGLGQSGDPDAVSGCSNRLKAVGDRGVVMDIQPSFGTTGGALRGDEVTLHEVDMMHTEGIACSEDGADIVPMVHRLHRTPNPAQSLREGIL